LRMIRETASKTRTCVERCALEFVSDLESIFGRVVTRAECERMALECDPCKAPLCVVAQRLTRGACGGGNSGEVAATAAAEGPSREETPASLGQTPGFLAASARPTPPRESANRRG